MQALAYEPWDETCMPPHLPKTSEACCITHVINYKPVFQMYGVSHMSIQKVF